MIGFAMCGSYCTHKYAIEELKKTLLPIRIDVDLTDATQKILDGLQQTLGESSTLKVNKNVTVTKYSKYNEIGEILIPDEAKNAPETVIY